MKFIFQLDSTLRSQLIKIQISVKESARDKKENGQKAPTSEYVYPLIMDLLISLADYQHMAFFEKGSINHFEYYRICFEKWLMKEHFKLTWPSVTILPVWKGNHWQGLFQPALFRQTRSQWHHSKQIISVISNFACAIVHDRYKASWRPPPKDPKVPHAGDAV